MATISENLLIIKGIKDDIKSAIIEKGQTVEDDFSTYAEAILNISGGGGEEYTPLEYLGSDSDGFFDTGYPASTSARVEFGIEFNSTACRQNLLISGSFNTSAYNAYFGGGALPTNMFCSVSGGSGSVTGSMCAANTLYNFSFFYENGALNLYRDGVRYSWLTKTAPSNLDNFLIMYPVTQYGGHDAVTYKLYYVKIYEGDELVRDFTPVYNSEGIVGFYDSITKTFIEGVSMNVHPDLGTIYITDNGEYDVSEYNFASVNVQPKDVPYFDYGSETGTLSILQALRNIQFPSTYAKYTSLENAFKGLNLETVEIDNLAAAESLKSTFESMENLKSISLPKMPSVRTLDYAIRYDSNIETPIHLTLGTQNNITLYGFMTSASKVPELTITGGSGYSFGYMCERCSALTYVDMSGMLPAYQGSTSTGTSLNSMFKECSSLETIKLPDLSGKSSDNSSDTFKGCTSLKNLEIGGLGDYQTLEKWRLEEATQLTVQSLNNVIAALPTITSGRKCSLGATNLAKLSEAEIAVATAKGWTLI